MQRCWMEGSWWKMRVHFMLKDYSPENLSFEDLIFAGLKGGVEDNPVSQHKEYENVHRKLSNHSSSIIPLSANDTSRVTDPPMI